MSEIRQLWLLPIITCSFGVFGIVAPYVIGGAEGHLQWILGFISDGGALAPEKNIFSALQNISAILIGFTIYVKHLQFIDFYENRRTDSLWRYLAWILLFFGLLAAFGLGLVGDFSEMDERSVHDVSAGITFGGATIYIILSAGLSFLTPLLCSFPTAILRVALAIMTAATLIFHTAVLSFELFLPPDTNVTKYKGDDQPTFVDYDSPYFAHHTVATGTEWLLGFLIFAYFLTFIDEFRKGTLTLPSVSSHSPSTREINKDGDDWR